MTERSVSLILVAVTGALLAMIFALPDHDRGDLIKEDKLSHDLNAMSPSAAGLPSAHALRETPKESRESRTDGDVGGTKATGRVSDIYLKVAPGVFLALDRAPETLRKSAERWVDVDFPDLLANGAGAARALITASQSGIQAGDIVEIKFAHKSTREAAQFFPVKETTRVTELIAKRDEMLAKDYEQRIVARNTRASVREPQLLSGSSGARPQWLPQAAGITGVAVDAEFSGRPFAGASK